MSHVTSIGLKITDLDALEEAAECCGLELKRDVRTFAWWGRFEGDSVPPIGRDPKDYGTCEHVLQIPGDAPRNGSSGPWSIGLAKALDGNGYEPLFDSYGTAGRRLLDRIGPNGNTLRREYAAAVTMKRARATLARKGWSVEREPAAVGNGIRIKLRKR